MRNGLFGLLLVVMVLFAVPALANDAAVTKIFPQVADGWFPDGTYYKMMFTFINREPSSWSDCTVRFYGLRLTIDGFPGGVDTDQFTFHLEPGSWAIWGTAAAQPFRQGYATVTCVGGAEGVQVLAVYSYYGADGHKISEATVFPTTNQWNTKARLILDNRKDGRLGIAIANTTPYGKTFWVSAVNGQKWPIYIPARTSVAKFVDEIVPDLYRLNDFRGIVDIGSDTAGAYFAAIGLRYTGAAFTTIPATDQN